MITTVSTSQTTYQGHLNPPHKVRGFYTDKEGSWRGNDRVQRIAGNCSKITRGSRTRTPAGTISNVNEAQSTEIRAAVINGSWEREKKSRVRPHLVDTTEAHSNNSCAQGR